MSLINRMRKQEAIYWPPSTVDDFGRPAIGPLVELIKRSDGNYRVRWEEKVEQFVDPEGTERRSIAVVYVPALPGGGELVVGGWLWLGLRAALTDEAEPTNNAGAYQIRRLDHMPDLKNRRKLRTAYL